MRRPSMRATLALLVNLLLLPLICAQYPGPPSLHRTIDKLAKATTDLHSLKSAVRSFWLPQHASHFAEQIIERQLKEHSAAQAHRLQETPGVESLVQHALDKLSAAGPSVACSWDSTVHNSLKQISGTNFLLAANFKDNADVLPQIIREIWMLSSILPSSNLFVSVYESGSADSKTGQWLEILSSILKLMDVQHEIVTEGLLRRGEDEGRIDFLSKVRNKALEPLWAAARPNMTSKGWPADRIIYMNDVFVCAKDFVRLMLHPADMVCALDFWQRNEDQYYFSRRESRESVHSFRHKGHRRHLMASIYDLWVLRDTDGNMFGQEGAQSKYSAARLAAGLPFPVTSCWNGMVVMPAQPFRQGLRFRNHMEGECRASECSLVCHDLHRLGYGRIIVDPGVQLAYDPHDAAGLHVEDVVRDIAKTSWEDVRDGPQIEQSYFERDTELCCNEDELRWGKDDMGCTTRSFLHPNFTAMAFPDFATM